MKLGVFIPNLGVAATPTGLQAAALLAEELGFESIWVTERLLLPVEPTEPYPGDASGEYPDAFRYSLDPVCSLAYVLGSTNRIRIGTSVLVGPYYNPFLLARSLTTLDVLSHGRLEVGLGAGWLREEFEAVAVEMGSRGRRLDEQLRLLKKIWSEGPVDHEGEFFRLPPASIAPKPVQRPHPPISIGAFSPPALRRAARLADGLQAPGSMPFPAQEGLLASFRQMVADAGRAPGSVRIILRGVFDIGDLSLGPDRAPFAGSAEQVVEDLRRAESMGVDELICDSVYASKDLSGLLAQIEWLHAIALDALRADGLTRMKSI